MLLSCIVKHLGGVRRWNSRMSSSKRSVSLIFHKTVFSPKKKGLGLLITKNHDQLNSLLLISSFPELKFLHNNLKASGERQTLPAVPDGKGKCLDQKLDRKQHSRV